MYVLHSSKLNSIFSIPFLFPHSLSPSLPAMDDETPSTAKKRPCCSPPSPKPSELDMDALLQTFLELSTSSSLSIPLSFEKLLESRDLESEQNQLIDRALDLGSALVEAGKRCARKKAAKHNSFVWSLPPDLTTKVFSMLDMQSLCYAAATCSMFRRCSVDPLCYENIDLRTTVPKVNNAVVSTMIQRAGKVLQSLKLGILLGSHPSFGTSQPLVCTMRNSVDASGVSWNDKRSRQGKESSVLTRSCLNPLISDVGGTTAGLLLRRLHLYNIDRIDNASLCTALSACPSLLDLEIVGLHVELTQTLGSVSRSCQLLERFFFESPKTGRYDSLKSPTCVDFVNKCPHLTSLALRGIKLLDHKVRTLIKGFRKLKSVDFSTSYALTGSFLRNLGNTASGNVIEVLILRDCMYLKEVEVSHFLTTVLAGDFKSLKYIDISNREGLASDGDWYERQYRPSVIPLKQFSDERPDIYLLAEFPPEGSFIQFDQMIDSDLNSEVSLPSQLSSHSSDSFFMSTPESSYNTDQGGGAEDGRDGNYVIFEESSDELDFFAL